MSVERDTRAGVSVQRDFSHEDGGLHKGLKNRQLQMIAIGGAIGTGLFLGAGGRLANAGPGLFIVYAICGVFVFLMLRALGELVLHRPSSGSFVSYAREFFGEKAAFVAGWMYWFNWAMTAIVDITAIATYMHYWSTFSAAPQWLLALIALIVVLSLNLVSVKIFGEMEFWFALIKVVALTAFLVIGVVFLAGRFPIDGQPTGLSVISDSGGWFPTGALPLVVVISGVIFAYAAVELVGTAAGETENPQAIMPRAINTVIIRIGVFYCGSLILLALLLPYMAFSANESPFVTFFSKIGVPGAGDVMNFVVLTSAMSSLNAGLYSTGRIVRSMALNGSAPKFAAKLNKGGVPFGGIALTGAVSVLGVILNAVAPGEAFEIVLNASALGIISSWGMIVLCQLRLHQWSKKGIVERPAYRMFGAPYTGYLVLVFLAAVLVIMAIDESSRPTVLSLIVIIPLLIIGWYAVRKRVLAAAQERMGWTGEFPVKADRRPDNGGPRHSRRPRH